jgi:hypothetical protein
MEQDRLEKLRLEVWDKWRKRIQTLINTWRNGRLREESKYREEFDKAAEKYRKHMQREGFTSVMETSHTESTIKEAHDRMEGAIEDRNRAPTSHLTIWSEAPSPTPIPRKSSTTCSRRVSLTSTSRRSSHRPG